MTSAKDAGAATYAAEELSAAQEALTRYDTAVTQRDYKQALSAALTARDHGFQAAKTAAATKERLTAEIAASAATIERETKAADAAIAQAPRSAAKRADKLRQSRKAAQQALQDARTWQANGELTKAAKRLADVTAALTRDLVALAPTPQKTKK